MREDQPPRRTRFGWGGSLRYPRSAWRIRLVAYGARLESVLGASPRGFESPILRRSEGPVTCRYAGGGPFTCLLYTSDAAGPYSMVRIESGSVPPRNAWYSASSSSTRGGAARSSLPHLSLIHISEPTRLGMISY